MPTVGADRVRGRTQIKVSDLLNAIACDLMAVQSEAWIHGHPVALGLAERDVGQTWDLAAQQVGKRGFFSGGVFRYNPGHAQAIGCVCLGNSHLIGLAHFLLSEPA